MFKLSNTTMLQNIIVNLKNSVPLSSPIDLNDHPANQPNTINFPSINLDDNVFNGSGRFENGKLEIAGTGVTNQLDVKGNGDARISIHKSPTVILPLPFNIIDNLNNIIVSGEVTEVLKFNNNAFIYSLNVLNGSLNQISGNGNYRFQFGGSSNPVIINNINSSNNQITTTDFSLSFIIWDDDARTVDNILPYDFSVDINNYKQTIINTFKDAYVLPVEYPYNNSSHNTFKESIVLKANHSAYYVLSANSRMIEDNHPDKIWVVYTSAVFQTDYWRKDRDPDFEHEDKTYNGSNTELDGVNLGFAQAGTSVSNVDLKQGGQTSLVPFETIRDANMQGHTGHSFTHEIAHQFRFGHINDYNNLMHSLLPKNNGIFDKSHINLIRSRKSSPGYPNPTN